MNLATQAAAIALLLLGVAACGAAPPVVVKTRASREFACPEEKVEVIDLGGASYKVKACGNEATYSCLGGNVGNPYDARCTREAAATPAK